LDPQGLEPLTSSSPVHGTADAAPSVHLALGKIPENQSGQGTVGYGLGLRPEGVEPSQHDLRRGRLFFAKRRIRCLSPLTELKKLAAPLCSEADQWVRLYTILRAPRHSAGRGNGRLTVEGTAAFATQRVLNFY